ncbi:MAG: hypothetical protein JWO11_451 [Nocardioides sp.]|nr:hypothetical protein [Nocardioides sp.]
MGAGFDPTRVLYVGGTGRSGSTVLANVLGELEGMVSVGEVRFLWQRGILQNRLCGCGLRFGQCPWWSEVLDLALGPGTDAARAELAVRTHQELTRRTRLRQLPTALASHRLRVTLRPDGELEDVLGRVYAAISAMADGAVVVDSSKLPTYAAMLATIEDVDPHVVHMLRDPRAAAYSWLRNKHQPDLGADARMERRSAAKSAVLWAVWNRALETLVSDVPNRYARITYETFLSQPDPELRRVLEALNLEPSARDLERVFANPRGVQLSTNHTVAGNPARHQHGLVPIVLDDEWTRSMRGVDRRAVTALTLPALRHYGYRLAG